MYIADRWIFLSLLLDKQSELELNNSPLYSADVWKFVMFCFCAED